MDTTCGTVLINHKDQILVGHVTRQPYNIWAIPKGLHENNESYREAALREFKEETNLSVEVQELVHVNELLRKPYHAVECFFEVKKTSGSEKLGKDPELSWDRQLLHDLQWMSIAELPEIDFAPSSLVEKIQHWDRRFNYPVF